MKNGKRNCEEAHWHSAFLKCAIPIASIRPFSFFISPFCWLCGRWMAFWAKIDKSRSRREWLKRISICVLVFLTGLQDFQSRKSCNPTKREFGEANQGSDKTRVLSNFCLKHLWLKRHYERSESLSRPVGAISREASRAFEKSHSPSL